MARLIHPNFYDSPPSSPGMGLDEGSCLSSSMYTSLDSSPGMVSPSSHLSQEESYLAMPPQHSSPGTVSPGPFFNRTASSPNLFSSSPPPPFSSPLPPGSPPQVITPRLPATVVGPSLTQRAPLVTSTSSSHPPGSNTNPSSHTLPPPNPPPASAPPLVSNPSRPKTATTNSFSCPICAKSPGFPDRLCALPRWPPGLPNGLLHGEGHPGQGRQGGIDYP